LSTPNNLLRDLVHGLFTYDRIGISQNRSQKNRTLNADTVADGLVFQTVGAAYCVESLENNMNTNQWAGSGLLMQPPGVDATPYRIKLHYHCRDAVIFFVIGYGPVAPTGTDDQIQQCIQYPIGINGAGIFDEVVLVPGTAPDPELQDNPIFFGIALSDSDNNTKLEYALSVQNLARTAPQFASSMS
jgi:hypothetical protein